MSDYPKALYRDGSQFQWDGRPTDTLTVDNPEAEAAGLATGWLSPEDYSATPQPKKDSAKITLGGVHTGDGAKDAKIAALEGDLDASAQLLAEIEGERDAARDQLADAKAEIEALRAQIAPLDPDGDGRPGGSRKKLSTKEAGE